MTDKVTMLNWNPDEDRIVFFANSA